ncbi:MAG TPA: sigma-54 dependent transcriptional regulator [Chitinophagaceae bacterium]|nr:sigma-54 dependent transcriptional regulator [Chitinophagaceae bacterium]
MAGKILIIDDEEKLRRLLRRILELEGYMLFEASSGKSALQVLEKEEDIRIIISDVKLPDINGLELIRRIKAAYPFTEIIVLTAFGSIQDGVSAIKNGAFDYITKGDDNDRVIPLVDRAMEKTRLQHRVQLLENKIYRKLGFDSILGNARVFQDAIHLARKVAPADTAVLLQGETGTGKEVFAEAIHYESLRRLKPFVAVNCSALGRDILESEIFGHKAGAFTGAVRDKRGLFEEADEGTIFLDEIGDMDPDLQAKLLRVLETGTFIKVGDTRPVKVNVRVIAATNKDLLNLSSTGVFRADLYYRLSVFRINLPSLHERIRDIPLLATHFLQVFSAKMNRTVPSMSEEFAGLIRKHRWKGNVRELKNIMERVVILCEGNEISADLLPPEFREGEGEGNDHSTAFDLATVEKSHIRRVLLHTRGNKTETARLLGIGLTTLYRKIEEYQLDSRDH